LTKILSDLLQHLIIGAIIANVITHNVLRENAVLLYFSELADEPPYTDS
jgi:hypothetical protein